jgi:uncharacterized membrane protein YjjB (DUF3815 family)
MNLAALLLNSLWAGCLAAGIAFLFSAPNPALFPSFCCGFVVPLTKAPLIAWGAGQNLASFVAAAIVVLLAIGTMRSRGLPPIVVAAGIIPLGPAVPFFRAIVAFLKFSSSKDDALVGAHAVLLSNLSDVFTTTLAVAGGVWAGLLIGESVIKKIQRSSR